MNWLFLALAISSEVVGTTALKASLGFTRPGPSALVVVAYAASFYFLSLTLATMPVGIAYAVWSGLGMVLVTLVGWLVYGQTISLPALGGMVLIAAGVLVINLASNHPG